jgi:hypothetical protein
VQTLKDEDCQHCRILQKSQQISDAVDDIGVEITTQLAE